jgi:hypothetical protein
VDRSIPTRIDVTRLDRGYAVFSLFNKIVAAGNSYVCRIRDNSECEIQESRTLSAAAQGVPSSTSMPPSAAYADCHLTP